MITNSYFLSCATIFWVVYSELNRYLKFVLLFNIQIYYINHSDTQLKQMNNTLVHFLHLYYVY